MNPYINYQLGAGENLNVCPYNESHRILDDRFSRHLMKCRSNHIKDQERKGQDPLFGICKYNYMHHIPIKILKDHEVETCPDREDLASHMAFLQSVPQAPAPAPPAQDDAQDEAQEEGDESEEETWEDLPEPNKDKNIAPKVDGEVSCLLKGNLDGCAGYNPSLRLARDAIVYIPKGLTKAQNREFRAKEHERWVKMGFLDKLVFHDPAEGERDPETAESEEQEVPTEEPEASGSGGPVDEGTLGHPGTCSASKHAEGCGTDILVVDGMTCWDVLFSQDD